MTIYYLLHPDIFWALSFLAWVISIVVFGVFYGPPTDEEELLMYLNANQKLSLQSRFNRFARHMKKECSFERITHEVYGPDVEQALLVCLGADKNDEDNQHVLLKREGAWMLDF